MTKERDALAQRWDLAVTSAQFGVWDLDVTGEQVHYPAEWKRLLGYEPTEGPDATVLWRSRVHPDDLPDMMARLSACIDGTEPVYESEFRLRASDGRWLWLLSRGRAVARDASGRAVRVVGTLTDLTDRRSAEEAHRARERAEAANAAKTQFLSRMSHELRTPLNAVLGFAQLIEQGLGEADVEEQRRYVRHIQDAGWHLLGMIDDILDLSRIESGHLSLQEAEVPVGPLVREVCDMLRPMAARAGVALQVAGEVPEAPVRMDVRRVRQVLTNLLTNAIKYNRPGGRVDVSISRDASRWALAVADTGLGLPAGRRDQLFQPFQRLGRERMGIEGVGIGLVLTRWLVERLGGHIEVDSEEGEGSVFRVELPLAGSADRAAV